MLQLTDEELIKHIKNCKSEVYTLAEIHKTLLQNNLKCSIEDLRLKIIPLHRDGYLGRELTNDGVNMYFVIFDPESPD